MPVDHHLLPTVVRQVNFEGSEHGVTPLAAACPAMHIMEVPTLFLGALWLPYRRDHEELKEAMRAAGPVGVLFAHADVVRCCNTLHAGCSPTKLRCNRNVLVAYKQQSQSLFLLFWMP